MSYRVRGITKMLLANLSISRYTVVFRPSLVSNLYYLSLSSAFISA